MLSLSPSVEFFHDQHSDGAFSGAIMAVEEVHRGVEDEVHGGERCIIE